MEERFHAYSPCEYAQTAFDESDLKYYPQYELIFSCRGLTVTAAVPPWPRDRAEIRLLVVAGSSVPLIAGRVEGLTYFPVLPRACDAPNCSYKARAALAAGAFGPIPVRAKSHIR